MRLKTILASVVTLYTLSTWCIAEGWTQFGGPGRGFRIAEPLELPESPPTKHWQKTLGAGMSGVVERDGTLFTSYLVPFEKDEADKPESERTHRESIVALDASNGQICWKHVYDAGFIEAQQAFGGRSRAPQATPAICDDRIVAIGFTGQIHCLDRDSGKVIWKKNAIDDFGAEPVQFGFSSSPLPMGDKVLLHVGGQDGGLICLNSRDGSLVWNVPCNEASYATPVRWDRPQGTQIVFATRNRVLGVDFRTGKQLWSYAYPSKGLTNVPTPLPVSDTGIVVSGQGIQGTQRLDIVSKKNGEFAVQQTWKSKAQFFYCNWVLDNEKLLGCDGMLFVAIDVRTGKTLGRFRGYNDGNILLFSQQALIFDGNGNLSTFRISNEGFEAVAKYAVLNERCWTPPTPVGNSLFCRGGDQLLCIKFEGGDPRAAVVPMRVRKAQLAFGSSEPNEDQPNAMERIVAAFEKHGPAAAWKVYSRIRDEDPDAISFRQRQELSKMAESEGLNDFAKKIKQHAAADFPKEFADANRKVSSETTVGENGLLYRRVRHTEYGAEYDSGRSTGPGKTSFRIRTPNSIEFTSN